MKKLMLSICLLMGGAVLVNAQQQDTTSTSTQTPSQSESTMAADQDRMQIQVSELPQSIRTSLESQDFSGWTISAAYKLDESASSETSSDASSTQGSSSTGSTSTQGSSSTSGTTGTTGSSTQSDTSSEGNAAYLVELKNGAETKTVKFDKDGNKLDHEKESDQK